jgi:sulfatase modifying factor 1
VGLDRSRQDDVTDIAPVGTATLGAARWGHMDMTGQLYDWTLDREAPYVTPCVDCANLTGAGRTIIRGGVFDSSDWLPTGRNGYTPPTVGNVFIGIRCARSP